MIWIGCHLSVTKGYAAMGETISRLGGDTFAWFPRNPRGGMRPGAAKPPLPEDVHALLAHARREGFGPLVAHGSYTMNLCSAREDVRAASAAMLAEDLARLEEMPGSLYNLHPGCHTGQGTEAGIAQIAAGLNGAMRPGMGTTVLLETMAGKGSEVGGAFEELREILDRAAFSDRVGVCLDTCHVWDAGHDLRGDLDGELARFDAVIGLQRLMAVHLNDSRNPLGSRKDRHEKLGQGSIGAEALRRVVRHPALQGLPFILETPNDEAGWAEEIRLVREWMAP